MRPLLKVRPVRTRSSRRHRAAEETDHPHEVIQAALAHVVQNKVEAAYARSDLFRAAAAHGRPGGLPRWAARGWAARAGRPATLVARVTGQQTRRWSTMLCARRFRAWGVATNGRLVGPVLCSEQLSALDVLAETVPAGVVRGKQPARTHPRVLVILARDLSAPFAPSALVPGRRVKEPALRKHGMVHL